MGNFDEDAYPEIVLVSRGWVFLLEHDGAVKWGPAFLEPVRAGDGAGPPTVADVDGDGQLEVAVAGSHHLAVFETDGAVKWGLPAADSTPNVGTAAFDFDGDGAAELVYADEKDLRLIRGRDGVVLFRDVNGTSTVSDSPVVADVDGDGEAEIVSVTDARLNSAVKPGVRDYGESGGRWPAARRIWNQFQYGVTNVDDDATVPPREVSDLALGHRWAQAGSMQ